MMNKNQVNSKISKCLHQYRDYLCLKCNMFKCFDCWDDKCRSKKHDHHQISLKFASEKNSFANETLTSVQSIIDDGFNKVISTLGSQVNNAYEYNSEDNQRSMCNIMKEMTSSFFKKLENCKCDIIIRKIVLYEFAKLFKEFIRKWIKKATKIQSSGAFDDNFNKNFYIKGKTILPKPGTLIANLSFMQQIFDYFNGNKSQIAIDQINTVIKKVSKKIDKINLPKFQVPFNKIIQNEIMKGTEQSDCDENESNSNLTCNDIIECICTLTHEKNKCNENCEKFPYKKLLKKLDKSYLKLIPFLTDFNSDKRFPGMKKRDSKVIKIMLEKHFQNNFSQVINNCLEKLIQGKEIGGEQLDQEVSKNEVCSKSSSETHSQDTTKSMTLNINDRNETFAVKEESKIKKDEGSDSISKTNSEDAVDNFSQKTEIESTESQESIESPLKAKVRTHLPTISEKSEYSSTEKSGKNSKNSIMCISIPEVVSNQCKTGTDSEEDTQDVDGEGEYEGEESEADDDEEGEEDEDEDEDEDEEEEDEEESEDCEEEESEEEADEGEKGCQNERREKKNSEKDGKDDKDIQIKINVQNCDSEERKLLGNIQNNGPNIQIDNCSAPIVITNKLNNELLSLNDSHKSNKSHEDLTNDNCESLLNDADSKDQLWVMIKIYGRYGILIDLNNFENSQIKCTKLPNKIKNDMVICSILDEKECFNLLLGGICKEKYLGLNFKYNIDTKEFSELKPMITPRIKFKTELFGRRVLCVGGWNGMQLRTFDYYDCNKNQWFTLPNLNLTHDFIALIRSCNQLYIVGQAYSNPKMRKSGLNKSNSIPIEYYNLDNIELSLDAPTNKWETYYIPQSNQLKINCSFGLKNGFKIIIFGFKEHNDTYKLDIKDNLIEHSDKMKATDTFSNNVLHRISEDKIVIVGDSYIHELSLSNYKWTNFRKIEYLE